MDKKIKKVLFFLKVSKNIIIYTYIQTLVPQMGQAV